MTLAQLKFLLSVLQFEGLAFKLTEARLAADTRDALIVLIQSEEERLKKAPVSE